jgi:hypothetical protein
MMVPFVPYLAIVVLLASQDCSAFLLRSHNNNHVVSSLTALADTRRTFFFQAAGALSMSPVSANTADTLSSLSKIQGPIQDVIAPGHWIGQFLGLNSRTVQWNVAGESPAKVSQAIVSVLTRLSEDEKRKLYIPNFEIKTATDSKVHVLTWTQKEWLDSFDCSLKSLNGGGTLVTASFYGTGVFPTSIPGAPLFNTGLFFFPFYSPGPRGEMLQDFRLRVFEGLMRTELQKKK